MLRPLWGGSVGRMRYRPDQSVAFVNMLMDKKVEAKMERLTERESTAKSKPLS